VSRYMIVLTARRHAALINKAIANYSEPGDEILIASATEEGRLSKSQAASLTKEDMTYIDFIEIQSAKNDRELSLIAAKLINLGIDFLEQHESLRKHSSFRGISLIKVSDNDMYTYCYEALLSFTERLVRLITRYRPDKLVVFGPTNRTFKLPERPDIASLLYDNELTYAPLVAKAAEYFGVPIFKQASVGKLSANIKPVLRAALIRTAKFMIILSRVLQAQPARRQWCSPPSQANPRIAIVIRGESEYWTIRPVLELIRQDKNIEAYVVQDDILKDPSAQKVLDSVEGAYVPIHCIVRLTEFIKLFARGVKLSRAFDRILNRLAILAEEPSHADSVHERILGSPVFAKEVLKSMSKRFSEEILFIYELSRFIEFYRPRLLVTMSMVDNWGPLVRYTGDKFGIKTLAIQNAAMPFISFPTLIYAHKFAVASQRQEEELLRLGASPEKIEVTGHPQYDSYLNRNIDRCSVMSSLNLPSQTRIVVLTTQPTRQVENEVLIRATVEAIEGMKDVFLVIKLHPRERMKAYHRVDALIKEIGAQVLLVHHCNVLDLIGAADLMISRFSTTIQSALMIGTPVIAYVAKQYEGFDTDYFKAEAVEKIADLQDLKPLIRTYLYDLSVQKDFAAKRREFLADIVGVADGRASERVIQVIHRMIGLNAKGKAR